MVTSRRRRGLVSDTAPEPVSTVDPAGVDEPDGITRAGPHKVEVKAKSPTVWTRVIPALVFLVVMLIFILQNFQNVQVSFISLHGRFPLALCLLFAAILGALIVSFLEVGRAVQIRRTNRRARL